MESNENNIHASRSSVNSSDNADATPASRVKVTFQIGAEDNMSDFGRNEPSPDGMPGGTSMQLEVIPEGRFKRKVSEIIQDKELFEELKKQARIDFGTVTKQLLKKSSIYAVSQVGHAESPYHKILWVLVLTAGLFGCCYQINHFLTLYFQYPVVVNLHVENNWNLEFPAVTVCNLNRMKKTHEFCMEHNITVERCARIPHLDRTSQKSVMYERRSAASCSDELREIRDEEFDGRMEFLTKYAQMESDTRKSYGYQLHDFIVNCSFNGEQCSFEFFSEFQSLRYGNCYTFNKRSDDWESLLKTSSIGVMNGLDLVLSLDPKYYLPTTASVGARVIVHDPDTDPNPEEQGINISPGFETTLAMKQTCVRRLPAPYKDKCVSYENDTTVRGRNQEECIISCIQEQNYGRCLCTDPTLPQYEDYKQCNMTNRTEVCCLGEVLNFTTEGLPCECPLPCFSTTYNLRISTSVWPSGINYFGSECYWCTDRDALEAIRATQARLKVYYSTLERTTYEQKEMFQNSELFSQLGGQMGLWLGLSLVAAFEIFENLVYIGKYCAALTCLSKDK